MMFGRPVMGIERSAYLVDGNNVIVKIFGKVKPKNNAKQILKALE